MSARVLYTEIPKVETEEPISSRIYGYKAEILNDSEDEVPADDMPLAPTEEHPANLVSSKCVDGMHRPALDIDVPVRLIPSSSPDHWHLYFPTVALDDAAYFKLLDALVEAGIVGAGFVKHSKRRGATWLRLPHVRKETQTRVGDETWISTPWANHHDRGDGRSLCGTARVSVGTCGYGRRSAVRTCATCDQIISRRPLSRIRGAA